MDQVERAVRRVSVRIERVSIDSVEILEGLRAGDEIVVSDMRRYSDAEAIRLK